MMAMVIMLYAPVSLQVHAAFSIFTFSLLVSPVTFDPTNPINVILAITFAIVMTTISWILWRYKIPIKIFSSSKKSEPLYSRVAQQVSDNHITDESNDRTIHPNEDIDVEVEIEMMAVQQPNNSAILGNKDSKVHEKPDRELSWEEIGQLAYVARSGVTGLILGLLGLFAFANQTRTNYWYVHSVWHVLMMLAAYYLSFGRVQLFKGLAYLHDRDVTYLDEFN